MGVEHAGREQAGPAHMRPQPGDNIWVFDKSRERFGGLHPRQHFAERGQQRARAARKSLKRLLGDEVHHRDARGLVGVMNARRDPGLGRDPHRDVLLRIAQRAGRAFDPQQIVPVTNLDPIGEGT